MTKLCSGGGKGGFKTTLHHSQYRNSKFLVNGACRRAMHPTGNIILKWMLYNSSGKRHNKAWIPATWRQKCNARPTSRIDCNYTLFLNKTMNLLFQCYRYLPKQNFIFAKAFANIIINLCVLIIILHFCITVIV